MSQALVQFLDNQYIECDGVESKFVSGIFGIFGHGCVVGEMCIRDSTTSWPALINSTQV